MSSDPRWNKARTLFDKGKLPQAKTLYKKLALSEPSNDAAWIMLGIVNRRLGLLDDAADSYRNALMIAPQRVEALNNLGNVLNEQGKTTEAINCFKQAVKQRPDYVEALFNLANACRTAGRFDEAIQSYRQLLLIQPQMAEAHLGEGLCYFQLRRPDAAERCYRRALASDPDNALVQYNLSVVLYGQFRFQDALEPCRQALARQPDDAAARLHLAMVLAALEDFNAAEEAYRRAREIDAALVHEQLYRDWLKPIPADACLPEWTPHYAFVHAHLDRMAACDWRGRNELLGRLAAMTRQELENGAAVSLPAFSTLALPLEPDLILAAAKNTGRTCSAAMAPVKNQCRFDYCRERTEKLRIGYLSGDFRNHPVAHLTRKLFGIHARDGFEISGYALNPDDGSDYRRDIAGGCDRFTELTGLSNRDAARKIHEDGIQILVDLTGRTQYGRPEILELQPAPLQVNYLGFPGTTGSASVPYTIVDAVASPPQTAGEFTECRVVMPECFQVNDNNQAIAATGITRADQSLPDNAVVFASFNKDYKIEPVAFNAWLNILHGVPDSVLWLANLNHLPRQNLRREARSAGIDGDRLIFAETVESKAQHLERHRLADLFLDTRVFNGHTTSSDVLWAGVPLITCPGERFASRVTASLLTAVGLRELIAVDMEAYQELAIRLAKQPDERERLRQRLQTGRLTSPLFDTERFARHLETAFGMMWERWLAGKPPAEIHVPALPNS